MGSLSGWGGIPLPDSGVRLLAGDEAERTTLRALLGGKRAAMLHFFDSC